MPPVTKYEREVFAAEIAAAVRRMGAMSENYYALDPYKLVRGYQRTDARYSTAGLLQAAEGKPCPYCANVMRRKSWRFPTRDHIRPKRAGGTLGDGNCAIVCSPCNNDKKDMMLHEFIAWLNIRNDPRRLIVMRFAKQYGQSTGQEFGAVSKADGT